MNTYVTQFKIKFHLDKRLFLEHFLIETGGSFTISSSVFSTLILLLETT